MQGKMEKGEWQMEGKEYFGKGLCVVCGLCFSKLHLAQHLHLSSKGLPVVIARYLFSFYLILQLRNFNLDIQFHGGLFSLLCSLGALILKAFIIFFFCSVPLMFNCIISMKCIVHIWCGNSVFKINSPKQSSGVLCGLAEDLKMHKLCMLFCQVEETVF